MMVRCSKFNGLKKITEEKTLFSYSVNSKAIKF